MGSFLSRKDTQVPWPPTPTSCASYSKDLKEAIKACPEFGDWLLNKYYVGRCLMPTETENQRYHAEMVWKDVGVEALKKQYTEHVTKWETIANGKRTIGELHVEHGKEWYKRVRRDYDVEMNKYKSEMNRRADTWPTHHSVALSRPEKTNEMKAYEFLADQVIDEIVQE